MRTLANALVIDVTNAINITMDENVIKLKVIITIKLRISKTFLLCLHESPWKVLG